MVLSVLRFRFRGMDNGAKRTEIAIQGMDNGAKRTEIAIQGMDNLAEGMDNRSAARCGHPGTVPYGTPGRMRGRDEARRGEGLGSHSPLYAVGSTSCCCLFTFASASRTQ